MSNRQESKALRMGCTIGYGIGAIGEGIGYNVFFSFFSFFLTTVAGIPPAVAGVISSVAVLWDAVTDPMIGSWSDTTRNPKGRRRPFIMTGSVLFGVSIAMVFFNFDIPVGLKTVYFILANGFYWIALTSCVIPHISLGSELTDDFNERTKLRSCAVTLMGIGTLIVTNAAGGINTGFRPGNLMLIEDHLNLTGENPLIGENLEAFGERFFDMTVAYDREYRTLAENLAAELDIPLQKGVYAWLTGPNYETPAEIRYLRTIGADAVGMSTVPEVLVARHCGLRVCGISCITNLAAGMGEGVLSHEEVKETADRVKVDFIRLVTALTSRM